MSISTSNTPRTHTLPTGSMAVVPKVQPASTSFRYFDVLDTLAKFEDTPEAFSPIMRSVIWSIDTACINAARNVLFALYKEAELNDSADPFGDFCQEVSEVVVADSWYYEDAGDNPVKELAMLLSIRNQWHDLGQAASAGDGRDYNPRSLRELLEAEKPQAVGVETREKLELLANRMAGGDETKAKLRLMQLVKREESLAVDRVNNGRKLVPTILAIIEAAGKHAEHDVRFDQLTLPIQRRLTRAAQQAVERAMVDVSKRRSLSTISYMLILDVYDVVKVELEQVLATRLSDDDELENASAPMSYAALKHQRQQKAVAIAAA